VSNFSGPGLPTSMGGAVDLSALVNRARQQNTAQDNTANVAQSASGQNNTTGSTTAAAGPGQTGTVRVAALVQDIAPAGLAKFVKVSEKVPVLVEFHTVRSEGSAALSRKLVAEVNRRGGEVLLLRLDGDSAGQLLQAFQIQGLPAVAALLLGQPVPMFNGDQEPEVISQVFDKLLQLAKENGVSQVAQVDADAPQPEEPKLPPRHQAAQDAIEAGYYAKAVSEYEAALREAPADVLAATGLAQAGLLLRTDNLDLQKVLSEPSTTLESVLQKADVLAVIGQFEKSFQALLDTFEVADKEDREKLRGHLLELFKVAGSTDPAVAQARTRLTNLLY